MTETDIQIRLHSEIFSACDLCLPNYTPRNWWECDFFHLTKAGYMVEHEIKLSRSDFFADAKKQRQVFEAPIENKNSLLQMSNERGPRQFWFVIPEGLVDESEIPEFAGLKTVKFVDHEYGGGIRINTVKAAPFLHKNKVNEQVKTHALSVCYYRYWNEKIKLSKIS